MKKTFKIILILGLLFANGAVFGQSTFTVSGKVTDANNVPLPGVTIIVLNTTRGTSTDFDGNYSISVAQDEVLQFSYLGYKTASTIITNQTTLNVVLDENTSELDEVVVIGYGTQRKSTITGSISKVVNDDLDEIPVARVDEALIGQVSGVNIQATNAEAGGAPTINIRGVGSVSADTGPALVVDGIVVSSEFLANIDMNDVESFEVLKDAASASIYGSEGANGVILITTKSGKSGKTKFSYETFTGFKEAHGSDDYRKDLNSWAAREEAATGSLSGETLYALDLARLTGVNRDWQDVFFNGGIVTSHSLSARGGNENSTFSASLRSLHDEGVVITDDYKLYTANLKFDTKIGKKLKFGLRASPSYTKQRTLPTSIHNPTRQSPWLPIYHTAESLQFINRSVYPDVGVGDYFWENHLENRDYDNDGNNERPRTSGDSNPYQQYVEREHYEFNTKLFGSTYLSYKLAEGLIAKTSLGITLEQRKRDRYDGVNYHAAGASRSNYYLQNRERIRLISDNTIDYSRTFGDHDISVLGGLTVQQRKSEISEINANGFTDDRLKNVQGANPDNTTVFQSNIERKKIGVFARVNYAYKDKYLFNASFRRDGSSVFGIKSKWGNFPAVSVGWNVAKENFLLSSDLVSNLKFRDS